MSPAGAKGECFYYTSGWHLDSSDGQDVWFAYANLKLSDACGWQAIKENLQNQDCEYFYPEDWNCQAVNCFPPPGG